MGRTVTHKHAVKGKTVRFHPYSYDGAAAGAGYWIGETLCGATGGGLSGSKDAGADRAELVATHNRESTCPKCAAIWGAAKLAKLGGRVRIEKREATPEERGTRGYKVDSDYQPFRSWWRILIDGVERGSIVNERGFGTLWEVRQMKEEAGRYGWTGRAVGNSTSSYRRNHNSGESEGLWPINRASKESAAAACLALAEAGLLPTPEEMTAAKEAEAERRRQYEAESAQRIEASRIERERKEAERAERMTEARLAFESIMARPDVSNLEAAGIASARRLLGIAE